MPTIDDLREMLASREIHAGDPEVVRERLRTPTARRRVVLPAIAAAAVVALAVAVAAFTARHTSGAEQPASSAPEVRWHVSFAPIPGYELTRTEYVPQYQMGLIEPTQQSGLTGSFWRYAVAAFRPQRTGQPVSINGRTGYFSGAADGSQVAWEYAPDAWAVVAGTYILKTGRTGDVGAARAAELTIARAMRFGRSSPVRLPFALRSLPPQLTFQAAYPHGNTNCVGYGTGDPLPMPKPGNGPDDYGTVLSVCRVHAGERMWRSGDRWMVRVLPDGTELTIVVNHKRLADISAAQLRRIADRADVSPKPDDRRTWLPIAG